MAQIIDMPKLSDTMTVGTLVKWLKKEGDAVKSGAMLAEIETDKATMELECFFDGTLLKIYAPAGSQIAVGAPLCAVGKTGEVVPDVPAPTAPKPVLKDDATPAATATPATPAPAKLPAQAPVAAPAAHPEIPSTPGQRIRITPLAKKLAAEKGVDPARVQGTGPSGRIVRADVIAAATGAAAPKAQISNSKSQTSSGAFVPTASAFAKGPIQEEKTVAVSNVRGIIAKRLLESKTQIPHFYLNIEIDAGPLLELRQQLNTALEKSGVKLSVNDFILKGSAEALRRVPTVNCSWEGAPSTGSGQASVRQHSAAHVSFAVAIDDGLITPVVRDAHLKTVFAISDEAKSLAKRAKDKKLAPNDFTGGTFCVSNLGMMGIESFSAIINPPNAAILAVGTTVKKPVVKNDQIVIGQTMMLTLSVDHRVVDGAVGAQFLAALKQLLESPSLLLI
ncbi:MAG: pyruvate dehydrogenase complex dihydrolipoamide acetyltransferase [Verrucomicrobia bacterium]|nr:pyruvate dehydrogenase complex dihydrolipoamide acetyltransferase [Verrucomicrobiota bacterium]